MSDNSLQDVLNWLKSPERTQQVQGIGNSLDSAIEKLGRQSDIDYANNQQFVKDPRNASPELMQAIISNQMGGPLGFAPVGMIVGKTASGVGDLVAKAEQLSAQGYPESKIRELLGIERVPSKDGVTYGYQISDAGAKVNQDTIAQLKPSGLLGSVYKMSDVLDHPELYAKYPEMRNIPVEAVSARDSSRGVQAFFDPSTKNIGVALPSRSVPLEEQQKYTTSSLLHELQHWVQNKEGWARGGNSAMFDIPSTKKASQIVNKVENDIVKSATASLGFPVQLQNLDDIHKSLTGKTKYISDEAQAILDNPNSKPFIDKWMSVSSLSKRVDTRKADSRSKYERLAGEEQARATQKQFDKGTNISPLTNLYDNPVESLIYRDPFKPTIK